MEWHEHADVHWRLDHRDTISDVTVAFDGSWLHIRRSGGVVETFPIHDIDQVSWWEHGEPSD